MAGFHTQVRMAKFDFKDSQFAVNMNGIVPADVGKAVTYDNTEDNAVKLAGNGDPIIGVVYTVEDRINEGQYIGTVEMRFAAYLPIKAGLAGAQVVARGKKLCGAGAGEVRAIDPATEAALLNSQSHPHCWGLWKGKAIGALIV